MLEIQCVDLVQGGRSTAESTLTYVLSFSSAIRPNGIAFADPDEHDALDIFVLCTNNELFTFTLRRDLLIKPAIPSSTDFDPSSCFKVYNINTAIRPYKLVATSSLELLVSLNDGRLLQLTRKPDDHGSVWRESFFAEGGWTSGWRGIIKFQGHNTQHFYDTELEPSAMAALEVSPDSEHIYTVSLNHTLKAWNKRTGKVGVQIDLLDEVQEATMSAQYLINPSPGALMKVLHVEEQVAGDRYYIVTNSPKDHQFKFWAVRDADSVQHGIRDVRTDLKLIPPVDELMNTNVWQLADFHFRPGPGWRETELWIRVRSGALCRTFTLTFDLYAAREDIEDAWRNKWAAVEESSIGVNRLETLYPREIISSNAAVNGPQNTDSMDKALDFLFYPGRFSSDMLETALFFYRKSFDKLSASRPPDAGKPLQERFILAIHAQIGKQQRITSDASGIESYELAVGKQWAVLFGLIKHLHEKRFESLSLAFDAEDGMPWSVHAGAVAPVRKCSEVEVLHLNETIFTSLDEGWIVNSLPLADSLVDEASVLVARLLAAAQSFRRNLSPSFNHSFTRASFTKTLKAVRSGSAKQEDQALQELYDTCGFASEVSDQDFNRLTDAVQDLGGLGEVENDLFLSALDRLTEESRGQSEGQALTLVGDKVTIRGAQETLQLGHTILLDLLALLVFMSQDLESDELAEGFRPGELYTTLITRLKEYNVLLWLASNMRQEKIREKKESSSDALQLGKPPVQPVLTLLESIFIGDWTSLVLPDEPWPTLVTYWTRAWTFGPNLVTEYDGVTGHIMANLVKNANYRLALDFVPFLPDNPWTQYLKGRLYLAEGEYEYAAVLFKSASERLSQKTNLKIEALDSSHLLPSATRLYFADGVPRYYLHIVSLFEAVKLISYAADFAALALHHLESENQEDADSSIADLDRRKQSTQGSPAATRIELAMEEMHLLKLQDTREDILGRLFNASLQTARFEQAFDALVKFGNPAL